MIQAGLDIRYMIVDIWKTFVVVENWKLKWVMYKGTTNFN